ncbi:MAG: PEP-CTERM sorting domain-containing protein [Acidobacteriaceae bacterium]
MIEANEPKRAWGLSTSGVVVCLTALILCLAAPRIASADSITSWTVNAYVSADAAGNPGSTPPYQQVGGTESYGSNYTIFYNSEGNIPVGSAQDIYGGCCSTYTTVPTQSSLTSVALGIAATNNGIPEGAVVANSNAYADLATGSVGVSGNSNQAGVAGGTSNSVAALADTLTFNVPGATSSTVTDIGVQWSISGGLSSGTNGESNMLGELVFGNADLQTEWESDNGTLSNAEGTDATGTWQSYDVASNTAGSVIIDGVYQLTGSDFTVPLELFLQCRSDNDSSCDYYDTESINFTLPAGVTYTSASGDFLSQPLASPVPEPGSFLLFGTGLLALGFAVRRWGSLDPGCRTGAL